MRFGIQKKFNILLFLGSITFGLCIGIIFYFKYTDFMMKSVVEKLYTSLYSIYNIVETESLPKLNKNSQKTSDYLRNWKKIKNIQNESKLAFVYIVLMNEKNQFFFVYDTADNPSITEESDNYLKIYPDPPSEAFESFASGKVVVVKGQYTNQLGTFKSAFYPIHLDGKIIGVIGADYDISRILDLQREAQITILIVLFLGIILVSLIGVIIKFWIVNPILKLNIGSKKIAAGNLDFFVSINQKDELGELAGNFNKMADGFRSSFGKIQYQKKQLEERILERTDELRNSLSLVQELKAQQEGDYYLTNLITDSLQQNRNNSLQVKIDFLIDQNKKFNFKGKTYGIGGDICIAGNLKFLGKQHTMFFNGDAMGKTMQGACGAIVIGSIVNSILTRSAANNRVITKEPEKWLKETFLEIQKVLEAFNGTMPVSCILGVIEDETGLLSYFNAGHPLMVLYRDEKASFIEEEITTSKLGTPFNLELGIVQVQLKPEDIVFCGSDGKDILLQKRSPSKEQTKNKDYGQFLKLVAESAGELNKIHESILKMGEVSDDLSLIRISYLGNLDLSTTSHK
jgi:HAMP domain-containing protein